MLASIPPLDPAITSAASPSAPHNGLLSITLFSSHDAASAKSVISDDDAYLSDPPPYEEDEAYVPVTAALLAEPVREIMCARGIKEKSTRYQQGLRQWLDGPEVPGRYIVHLTPADLRRKVFLDMQLFDVTELVIKIYKQLYRAVSGNNGSSSLREFLPLTRLNGRSFKIAVAVLWQKLPSADPLLHLLPDDVVQKQPENTEWHYAIRAYDVSLTVSATFLFDVIFKNLGLKGPLLPNVTQLKLVHPNDHLLSNSCCTIIYNFNLPLGANVGG
ncbi:hypothetical protein BDR06DRAFT_977979 [Suillus hirtellus]|nr:hypothetical protein BDR06DRAFT_977979 [Suillus hirtellus]